ncbi:MAG: hypothetical protein ACRDXE_03225 [Acidimicrobiales bacterium]
MSPAAPWPRRGVYRIEAGAWMVPSSSTAGAYYMVTWKSTPATGVFFECTCPYGRERAAEGARMAPASHGGVKECRHVREVAAAEQADGFRVPPVARIIPGAFVD